MTEGEQTQDTHPSELIRTKLTPPRLRGSLVARERLLSRLDTGFEHKLTLVSAPAGFGKTTLVREWIASRTANGTVPDGEDQMLPAGWVSLDEGDNDPVRFWRYVITSCHSFVPDVGEAALNMLRRRQQVPLEAVLTVCINDLAALSNRAVLVLEDYHLISAHQIHESVAFLLDHLPATLHVMLLTRSDPPLPLAQWRARNEVYELRAEELRFSAEETETFLRQHVSFSLTDEAVDQLESRTEGWIAGLQLVALALQRSRQTQEIDHFLDTFTGGHRHILEYLTAEVLAAQPASRQEFLLQTTFLHRMTASLCDAVTGRNDSSVVLEDLERANLFLTPLDAGQQWYRYHPLFAEAMQEVARRRLGDARLRALYNRASLWYEQHEFLADAVDAALLVKAHARAATLIERIITQHQVYTELHTLRRWVEQLPEELLRTHPQLCFSYAQAILFTSDRSAPATAVRVQDALQMAEDAWQQKDRQPKLGQVFALQSLVSYWQGDFTPSFAAARRALRVLPEEDIHWRGISAINVTQAERFAGRLNEARQIGRQARALCEAAGNGYGARAAGILLANIYVAQGDLDRAEQMFRQILDEAGDDYLDQGHAHVGLATLTYERNDLSDAQEFAGRAIDIGRTYAEEIGRHLGEEFIIVPATLVLARIDRARGETEQARQRLHALTAEIQRPARLLRDVQAYEARLALADGNTTVLERWLTTYAQQEEQFPIHQEQEALLVARRRITRGETANALQLLDEWRDDAHSHGRTEIELKLLLLASLAHDAKNDISSAREVLVQALALAEPSGYRRLFLDEGPPMAALLQATYPHLEQPALTIYARMLLLDFADEPGERHARATDHDTEPFIEPLSQREEEVLRLLAAGRSNPEIAEELIVSVNTIKTHVKHIYSKLDVHSREEAGDMARQLDLI